MKRLLLKARDYFCYCGISKEEYNSVKKDAYISNFIVWRVLHVLMAVVFGVLFIDALMNDSIKHNMFFYLGSFVYSALSIVLFLFVFKKESIWAQLYIYLSIILMFIFSAFIAANQPHHLSVTFMVFLIISPMFMIDKPFFMSIVLVLASVIFLIWMSNVKTAEAFEGDVVNTITFCFVGIFIHIVANSVRIREFVLRKQINEQKDLDDLTGLMNKGALTRNINEFLATPVNKGILFMLDIDHFKMINDTYGHDVGDDVIRQVGEYLNNKFKQYEIVGRFGGDEFILFIKEKFKQIIK